jgi:hypothetical protein
VVAIAAAARAAFFDRTLWRSPFALAVEASGALSAGRPLLQSSTLPQPELCLIRLLFASTAAAACGVAVKGVRRPMFMMSHDLPWVSPLGTPPSTIVSASKRQCAAVTKGSVLKDLVSEQSLEPREATCAVGASGAPLHAQCDTKDAWPGLGMSRTILTRAGPVYQLLQGGQIG